MTGMTMDDIRNYEHTMHEQTNQKVCENNGGLPNGPSPPNTPNTPPPS